MDPAGIFMLLFLATFALYADQAWVPLVISIICLLCFTAFFLVPNSPVHHDLPWQQFVEVVGMLWYGIAHTARFVVIFSKD